MPDKSAKKLKNADYNPEPFVSRLEKLLESRNESYREASLKSGLDHQAVRRALGGQRPSLTTCILLANHFGINPNELLTLAGWPSMKIFSIETQSAEHLPPEAVDVALSLAKIKHPATRKKVAEAIAVLISQHFDPGPSD